MMFVRPITKRDTKEFIDFAFTAGIGMTSMPKNQALLEQKIIDSENAFAKKVAYPGNENYLFVLENAVTHDIGGSCGIAAKTGIDHPKYFFCIEESHTYSTILSATQTISLMRPLCYRDAPSEICSLYLLPKFRKEGMGRLLSLSRFLFAAADLNRFDKTIYAEMRGFTDEHQNSPFWNGIGRHFFNMDYHALMHLRDLGNFDTKQVLPAHPIYTALLPKEVQKSIGKVHTNTESAFHMLLEEGFYLTNEVDVFDGGAKVEASTKEIRTIKESRLSIVKEITYDPIDSASYILSNNRLNFRACYSALRQSPQGVTIPAESAEILNIQTGDTIRFIPTSPKALGMPPLPIEGYSI